MRTLIDPIEAKIESAVHSHFGAQNRKQKLKLQDDINRLQSELAEAIATSLGAKPGSDVAVKARHIAKWNRFNPQIAADFFDTHWMFGRSLGKGFDIVFGNPPYIQIQKFPAAQKAIWQSQGFKTYAATADIYCLFYERGAQLLKPGGHLATSHLTNGCEQVMAISCVVSSHLKWTLSRCSTSAWRKTSGQPLPIPALCSLRINPTREKRSHATLSMTVQPWPTQRAILNKTAFSKIT
ncbi:Eco57I restriction-modification methylase domain-containing protein [Verrucomicrobium spinosum]|uniref:Eco57I restriction-modification methylase domain-containing protein n=1 Tax=Verrucomicrobium spinosum TaxID=2736 RepID=UPI001C49548C|nr:Eco57I restriction-modification methylase domain-containing protein [Verrucomicrobium spinosum]